MDGPGWCDGKFNFYEYYRQQALEEKKGFVKLRQGPNYCPPPGWVVQPNDPPLWSQPSWWAPTCPECGHSHHDMAKLKETAPPAPKVVQSPPPKADPFKLVQPPTTISAPHVETGTTSQSRAWLSVMGGTASLAH
jgi:hypothetical protein